MAKKVCSRRELLDRWSAIQEELEMEADEPSPARQRRILKAKEEWFSDSFAFLVNLPKENHIWCDSPGLMGPFLETFHDYFNNSNNDSSLKILWQRISRELGNCTQCVCQHHQAQESYSVLYEPDTVGPLLKVLHCLDEERITEHLKEINARLRRKEYNSETHSAEVVSLMFEVLMFPTLLDDESLVKEFQFFIEAVDESHEVTLSSNQQYPGIYALLFLKSGRARAVGFRLAGCMGKLKGVPDLEPLQPLLRKYIGFLESDALSTFDAMRPRVQLERINVWHGIKTLLNFLEAEAFEDGILEKYPTFLSIILNHVSDESPEFSCAVACLRASFEMLGCKLWLRTSLSPSMMRNTLLGQCFHTQSEKSHKDIFDLFIPFLQSLEALRDGEHEKQRRHFLYFLLHQVTHSRNFSPLIRKQSSKIAMLIISRGYTMNPPCPPVECAHMWGPSLVSLLNDSTLHSSLRQPAFHLINTIVVSDASALIHLKYQSTLDIHKISSTVFTEDEDEQLFSGDMEERDNSCWNEFDVQSKLTVSECKEWACTPMLWFEVLVKTDLSRLPASFPNAVFWALSHISILELDSSLEHSLSIEEWLSVNAREILSCFGWEKPNGSDDGGDGKESRNCVKVSSMATVLIKAFKRFAAHLLRQVERPEILNQWTWEPKMAESLILLLIDPHDTIRQADRVIMEHVSKTQGLTPGLQFLCSSATSLSAMFSGLRFALKQVLFHSFSTNFHKLHHFMFVTGKLLKEVVTSTDKSAKEVQKPENYLLEGGFLRQPGSAYLPVTSGELGTVLDNRSLAKFSYFLSAIMWPFILKCLEEGKDLVNNKSCQMSCVRLLETLPVVYEKICFATFDTSSNLWFIKPNIFDLNWLSNLTDWGNTSLVVVRRHWKQCMFSLLNCFKSTLSGQALLTIDAIEAIISHDAVVIDELKEKVCQLTISDPAKVSQVDQSKTLRATALHSDLFARNSTDTPHNYFHIDKFKTGGKLTAKVVKVPDIINLSDDETDKVACSELISVGSSSLESKKLSDKTEALNSAASVDVSNLSSSKLLLGAPGNTTPSNNDLSSKVQPPLSQSKGFTIKGINKAKENLSQMKDSTEVISSTRKVKSVSSSELDKENAVFKEAIGNGEDDVLELALDRSRQLKTSVLKQSVSAPKRQVVHIQLPTKNKAGFQNRIDPVVRRLKPPKLDDWYKPILELDYFELVEGKSDNEGERKKLTNFKRIPLSFQSSKDYVEIFRPLVLEEFKSQLQSSYGETNSEEMFCGCIYLLSVERIDDFHIVRGRPDDNESFAFKGCSENDLVLLTKEPFKGDAQHMHLLGKVERREKSDKTRTIIFIIRIYLPNNGPRFIKARRLLIERSKWFLSRIMSIAPQLREFQALSSLNDIPMLPIILNPNSESYGYPGSTELQLDKLPQPMHKILTAAYNQSQLQAISIAIGSQDSKRKNDLSLIQGPPGTGKTRTIVAMISALLSLPTSYRNRSSITNSSHSMAINNSGSNTRSHMSQSAAIARAWKDAAFAKQLIKDAENDAPVVRPTRRRVLICAQSNAAVDELVSRISKGLYGSDGKSYRPYLVRVGNSKTVHSSSLPFFIDTLVEQRLAEEMNKQTVSKNEMSPETSASLRAKLEKVVDSIRFYESKRVELEGCDTATAVLIDGQEYSDTVIGVKLNMLYAQKKTIGRELAAAQARERKISDESWSLKNKIRKDILREAEIVVATLSGTGGDLYGVCSESSSSNKYGNISEQVLFDVVVIDEAAQALEPATLIPLQLLKSYGTKCIMVGDPKQLPATVLSSVASKFLYECSMFERLQKAGHPVIMLTEQYRMHPEICKFPSMHFYDNKLVNGATITDRSAPFHKSSYLGPYRFFDIVDGQEYHGRNMSSLSLYNEAEVDSSIEILKFFKKRYSSEFTSKKIGIVTPYRSQLFLLRSRFSGAFGPEAVSDIEFNTIDGFQGREVDILVLSTVRASKSTCGEPESKSNGIGFVADVRRMNVALTRAKFSLWVVGNARTLQNNNHWAALVQNSKERNLFVSLSRPYNSIFLKDSSILREHMSSSQRLISDSDHSEKDKDAGIAADCTKVSSKEGKRGKTRLSNSILDLQRERGSKRHVLLDQKGLPNLGNKTSQSGELAEQAGGRFKETESKKSGQLIEGKKSHKQIERSGSAGNTSKKRSFCERPEDKIKGNVPLEKEGSMSSLIEKSKGARSSSARMSSSNLSQSESTNLSSMKEDMEIAKISNQRSSNLQKEKSMIAARKRQREDVEALLSSALISSKKSEASSRNNRKC